MTRNRREFLKATGGAIAAAAVLGTGSASAAEDPTTDYVAAATSNYRSADRGPGEIDWVVVHTIEGSYRTGINVFQNPGSNVSAHFVVGREPGQITRMVREEDVAWTAGNSRYNATSINIEMAGTSGDGFSDQLYRNVAELVDYFCAEYDVPRRHPGYRVAPCSPYSGSGGIIGHVQVPNPYDCSRRGGAGGHTDPGPYFDYDRLLSAMDGGGSDPAFDVGQDVVATADVNVRTSAEVEFNVKHTQPEGTVGTVKNGYVTADGYTWWWIHWENGVGGWSVQRYVDAYDGSDAAFQIGQAVRTTADLSARSGPGLDYEREGVADERTTGYVKDGYVTADGYTWWEVDYGTVRGWSVEAYLEDTDDDAPAGRSPLPFDVRTDLTDPVAVTGTEIDAAIRATRANSPLVGLGDTFVAAQERYSVNAVYQAAHAVHESYWGYSDIARDKKNLFGWGAEDSDPYNGAKRFDSFEDCVFYVMGKVADLYLTPGNWRYNGPHLEGMNEYYATDPGWAEKIADIYRRLADDL